jgi:hypothetical protein
MRDRSIAVCQLGEQPRRQPMQQVPLGVGHDTTTAQRVGEVHEARHELADVVWLAPAARGMRRRWQRPRRLVA